MSTFSAPHRSPEQRFHALAEGNRRRAMRAQRKALWKVGTRDEAVADFWDLLDSPPAWAEGWKVYDILLAIPGLGPRKALRTLNHVRISPVKTLAGLSDRQRHELGVALREWIAPSPPTAPTFRKRPKGICMDCGGPRSWAPGPARCVSCYREYRRQEAAPRLVCPDCGGKKQATAYRCLSCEHARRVVAKPACPRCGGRKRPASEMCQECRWDEMGRRTTCPKCGKHKEATSQWCWECRYGRPHPRFAR